MKAKPNTTNKPSASTASAVADRVAGLSITESHVDKTIWKPKSYGTVADVEAENVSETATPQAAASASAFNSSCSARLSQIFKGNFLENFNVDNTTYTAAQIRASFYPKFENEKSDQEVLLLI